MNTEKISGTHLDRLAIVYPRQSTPKQIYEHPESTKRQYALKDRASNLGWPDEKIVVIDEDLGQSGASGEWRPGFQRLAEGVAHGRIGGIFALDVSRLARSSADWHRLLELCGLADVVIADEQAIYNLKDYNDRMLLGMKGAMSEAETYWMRLRLEGGRLSKARRGEYHYCPPAGYEWDYETQRFRLDPSTEVQQAVKLVFERFRIDGSAYGVARYLARMGVKIPSRDILTKTIHWSPARHTQIIAMLHNPIYTGTYVYGRREERIGLVNGKIKRRKVRSLPLEEWKSVKHNRHPAYISWEEFMANQKKIEENITHGLMSKNRGAAREGHALLQGLALCGRCGRRMGVQYQGPLRHVQYCCRLNDYSTTEDSACWIVAGDIIDTAVEKQFLDSVLPDDIDLALSVANETERQLVDVDRQWQLRKERLQYEARLAERRFKAIDPENRVVARTLEKEWEEKLREQEKVNQEYEETQRKERLVLSKEDKDKIVKLSKNLRDVWRAKTTNNAERKNLLRILIREVTLTPVDKPDRQTRVQIWWQTGAVSEFFLPRKSRYTSQATPKEAVAMIRESFNKNETDQQIAAKLNRLKVPRKKGIWDAKGIQTARYAYGMYREATASRRTVCRRGDGLYSIHGVAEKMKVTPGVVNSWANSGVLPTIDGGGTTRARWFRLDKKMMEKLKVFKLMRFYEGKAKQ